MNLAQLKTSEDNGGMSSETVLADLASRVIARFLNMRLPSPRHPLVVLIRDGWILDEMETRGLIRAENNRTDYFPTLGTFALLDKNDEKLEYAHLGVVRVLYTLINLYETYEPSVSYSMEDLLGHVQERYDRITVDPVQISLGLYLLSNGFGALQSFSRSQDGIEIARFMIAERVLSIRWPETAWSDQIELSRQNTTTISSALGFAEFYVPPAEIPKNHNYELADYRATYTENDEVKIVHPKVFISYSWETREHRQWVLDLATRLTEDGIEVILDRWHLHPGGDLPHFMESSVRESDYVLVICTPEYSKKADARKGGVGWEAMIITSELAAQILKHKFIPILRDGEWGHTSQPAWIGSKAGIDLRATPYEEEQYELLLRELHQSTLKPPAIGKKPNFSKNNDL